MPLTPLREFVRRLWGTLRRNPSDPELEEELRSHLELAGEQAHRQGSTHDEARRFAQLQAGGVAQAMEALRDQRGLPWLANVARDVPYAIRTLGRSPSFTATVVLTLALGIGVNTAVFNVIHAVLLDSLPYRDPQRLVHLAETHPEFLSFQVAAPGLLAIIDDVLDAKDVM